MAEEDSKGLPSKIIGKVGDKLTDKLGEKIADRLWEGFIAAGIGSVLASWVAGEWACIRKPWCEVRGWSLGMLIATTVVTTAAAIYVGRRWLRTRRELRVVKAELAEAQKSLAIKQSKVTTAPGLPVRVPFQKITVEDHRLKLRWFIRRPPNEWLHLRDVATRVSPQAVQGILDGPFHAIQDCNAPLEETPPQLRV